MTELDRWTPGDIDMLKALAAQGMPYKRIARVLGRTPQAISRKMIRMHLRLGYAKRSAALALLAAGVPYMQVHRETGVPMSTLNRIKKEIA